MFERAAKDAGGLLELTYDSGWWCLACLLLLHNLLSFLLLLTFPQALPAVGDWLLKELSPVSFFASHNYFWLFIVIVVWNSF